jgi:crotonobetainyl-CoA:carnitine CoA-transferase CaiB-like acyl-CoA transferase
MPGALAGVRILEIAQGIAGPYTGMLLAEQGADVIKIEPPQGDAMRGTPGFHIWNRSKRSITIDLTLQEGHARIGRLAAEADVLITDHQPGTEDELGLTYKELRTVNPRLIYCHMPAFGSTGPHANRYPDDALVAAIGGLHGSQWSHRDGGVYLVIPIASYGAAFIASSAISAALFERDQSQQGQHLEVSWLAGVFAMQTGATLDHPDMLRFFSNRQDPLGPIPAYRLYQASDAWLFVACGNATFWNKFCLALEHPEWTADPRYDKAPWGILPEDRRELIDTIATVMVTKPREEWLRILRENDVPAAPVTSRQEFIEHPQIIHNGMRVEAEDPELGPTVQMGVPLRLSDTPGSVSGPAPLLGQHSDEIQSDQPWGSQVRPSGRSALDSHPTYPPTPPLAGVRVLDFSSYIAGTLGPMILAQLGADVIKVETFSGDAFRTFGFGFLGWNQGKRGICVNLSTPEGKEVVYDLVRNADVVVENLRPGATQRYGIDYATLNAVNPRIIHASVTGFGADGPDYNQPGFDPLLQARSGVMQAQGGHAQPPFYLTCGVCDYAAATLTAYGVSAALYARNRTGKGQHVETSLANAAMAVQSGDFIFYPDRPDLENGAADLWGTSPLYRIYPTADSSLFLAVVEDAHWQALGQVLRQAPNRPDLRQAYSLHTASEEDADGALGLSLADIFQTNTTAEWIAQLDLAGVPCAPIVSIAALFADEHIAANNLIATHRHPEWGEVRQTGLLATFSRTPTAIPRVAPILGQHTREVLHEVVGYSEEQLDHLLRAGAIKQAK